MILAQLLNTQGAIGILPAQLLMGRQLRTHLNLVVPDVAK